MIDTGIQRRIVGEPWYGQTPLNPHDPNDERARHVLKIPLDDGTTVMVENGSFALSNNALAVMAFLGVRPSTLDEAVGMLLPVVVTRSGRWAVAPFAVAAGRRALDAAAWGPSVEADS
jgi:hypothetical protein